MANMTNWDRPMSDVIATEMQSIVRAAAEPIQPDDSVKARIRRASRKLGLTYRRTRTFWYAHPCAVRASEADQLRQLELRLLAERQRRLAAELETIQVRLGKEVGDAAKNFPCVGTGVSLNR